MLLYRVAIQELCFGGRIGRGLDKRPGGEVLARLEL